MDEDAHDQRGHRNHPEGWEDQNLGFVITQSYCSTVVGKLHAWAQNELMVGLSKTSFITGIGTKNPQYTISIELHVSFTLLAMNDWIIKKVKKIQNKMF